MREAKEGEEGQDGHLAPDPQAWINDASLQMPAMSGWSFMRRSSKTSGRRLSDSLPGSRGSVPGIFTGLDEAIEQEMQNAGRPNGMSRRIKAKRRHSKQETVPKVNFPLYVPERFTQVHLPPEVPPTMLPMGSATDSAEEGSAKDGTKSPEAHFALGHMRSMDPNDEMLPGYLPADHNEADTRNGGRGSVGESRDSDSGSNRSGDEGTDSQSPAGGKAPRRTNPQSRLKLRRATTRFTREEHSHSSRFWMFEVLVESPWFEPVFALLICANTVMMAIEMQYAGMDLGNQMDYPGVQATAAETWPGAQKAFEVSEWIFGVLFCIELVIKALALRLYLVQDLWNWLDIACVALWILGTLATSVLSLDPALFRLLRLARLMRMLRLVRTLQGCESLYLMTASIKASMLALTWSAVLIFMIQMSIAMILNQLLQPYFVNAGNSMERRHRVYRYFGTFSKAFLTMFEYMLANWPPASRVLTEDVNELTVIFILGYQCIIGFAVVKVIMGVFLQVTFNVAATDDIIMISQKERAIANHTKKISRLFMAADQDGSGLLDKAEFGEMVEDPVVRQWLASMDCDVSLLARDPDMLFKLVNDDGSGQLTAEQLVKGVARMQGIARSIDLAVFNDQNRQVQEILEQVSKDVEELKGYMQDAGGMTEKEARQHLPEIPVASRRRSSMKSMRDSVKLEAPRLSAMQSRRGSLCSEESISQAKRILALSQNPQHRRRSSLEYSAMSDMTGSKMGSRRVSAMIRGSRPVSAINKRASTITDVTVGQMGSRPVSAINKRGSAITDLTINQRGSTISELGINQRGSTMTDQVWNANRQSRTSRTTNSSMEDDRSTVIQKRTTVSHAIFRTRSIHSMESFSPDSWWKRFNPLRFIRSLVRHSLFEAVFGILIFLNTLVMAIEVQYDGIQTGFTLNYPGETRPAKEVWPWAEDFFLISNWFFLVVFTVEVVLKLVGIRLDFFKDPWNYFDVLIVASGLLEAILTAGAGDASAAEVLPVDPSLLRFARLMRLLRLLKVVRAMKEFDSLHLMITSIRGSMSALLWSSALMFVVQMLIALVLNTMLESFLMDTNQSDADRHEIYMYFGNFSKAMLTMFEITLANWIPCARALTERVDEWYVIFALTHKFVIGFAVVMVITGVFLNETFRVSATDDSIMITQKQRQIITHTKKMTVLFQAADEDGNGILDREEFTGMMEDDSVLTWLSSMGLDVRDVDTLFTMVSKDSENEGAITAVELAKGLAHLKGNAKSLDMAVVMQQNRSLLDETETLKMSWNLMQMMGKPATDRRGRRKGAAGL